MMQSLVVLIAQQGTGTGKGSSGSQGMVMLVGLMLAMFVFMIVSQRGRRKEQRERKRLLNELSKNDKVMTIGGVIGTVVTVRDNEVVLKVDETSNTKMTFLKKAIQQVLRDGELPTMGNQ